jgi:hypothetical protein
MPESVVKDAYKKVKGLLADHFSSVPISLVTESPASKPRRALVESELSALNADQNMELVAAANKLLEAVKEHEPGAAHVVGVKLEDVEAANIRLRDIYSTHTGVEIKKAKVAGDIEIVGVHAGSGEPPKKS